MARSYQVSFSDRARHSARIPQHLGAFFFGSRLRFSNPPALGKRSKQIRARQIPERRPRRQPLDGRQARPWRPPRRGRSQTFLLCGCSRPPTTAGGRSCRSRKFGGCSRPVHRLNHARRTPAQDSTRSTTGYKRTSTCPQSPPGSSSVTLARGTGACHSAHPIKKASGPKRLMRLSCARKPHGQDIVLPAALGLHQNRLRSRGP